MKSSRLRFRLIAEDGSARCAWLETAHGRVQTPAFMPVATIGVVKSVDPAELRSVGAELLLGNAYHLWLRPGPTVVEKAGGLARFTGWNGPMLTDSGGFQVFSLGSLVRVTPEGALFKSHLDGSLRFLSPEDCMTIQRQLGADLVMPLDVCPPADAPEEELRQAVNLSVEWARRSLACPLAEHQHLFAIVQGGVDRDLRVQCAQELMAEDFAGFAVGGLAVGESKEAMYRTVQLMADILPADRPRYLMGVGDPWDLLVCVGLGMDLFDSVLPTRNGRHGTVWTAEGKLNLHGAALAEDYQPLDGTCDCPACTGYTRAYLRHLFRVGDSLGWRLASLHNLRFLFRLLEGARQAIKEGRYDEYVAGWRDVLQQPGGARVPGRG